MLVLMGMVDISSATTLHIGVEFNFTGDIYVHRFGGTNEDTWQSTLTDTHKATYDKVIYGRRWYTVDMNGQNSAVIRWNNSEDRQSNNLTGISTTDTDVYAYLNSSNQAGLLSNAYSWNYMTFRQNIIDKDGNDGDTWSYQDDNSTSHPDGDTFTFELTKAQIDASPHKVEGIRFRLRHGDMVYFNDAGSYINNRPQIYPTSPTLDNGRGQTYGEALSIAGNTSTYYQNADVTDYYWQINIPSYDYEKIVITAKYVNESGYKWKISADAYIAKTITAVGKATFGSGADVDFSGVAGLTAEKAKVNTTTGKITYTTATTLKAGEGALLSGSAGTYYIPVANSASADTEHNDLIGVTGADVTGLKCDASYNYYILTNRIQNGDSGADADFGFYKVNSTSGNNVRVGSAYLRTATGGAYAPEFFPLFTDSETTGINAVKGSELMVNGSVYNLNGQRVAQPTKGLYIVNGRKVVIK